MHKRISISFLQITRHISPKEHTLLQLLLMVLLHRLMLPMQVESLIWILSWLIP